MVVCRCPREQERIPLAHLYQHVVSREEGNVSILHAVLVVVVVVVVDERRYG